ncbi:MAG: hypothetical protein M1836_006526 [Candelina mexicana]|nr:MAG: hypothetical protein M1836_006526 [Candelina mexicana]
MAVQGPNRGATGGIHPWSERPDYKTVMDVMICGSSDMANIKQYKSPYGPKYEVPFNFHGVTLGRALRFGMTAGAFGGVFGFFALFFFADVPRVRKDILQKLPVVGEYYHKEIPPSDNPF